MHNLLFLVQDSIPSFFNSAINPLSLPTFVPVLFCVSICVCTCMHWGTNASEVCFVLLCSYMCMCVWYKDTSIFTCAWISEENFRCHCSRVEHIEIWDRIFCWLGLDDYQTQGILISSSSPSTMITRVCYHTRLF